MRISLTFAIGSVRQYKPCTEQCAADNIGDPMHTRDESAHHRKGGEDRKYSDSAPSEKGIFDTHVQLHRRRRHHAHNEHRC